MFWVLAFRKQMSSHCLQHGPCFFCSRDSLRKSQRWGYDDKDHIPEKWFLRGKVQRDKKICINMIDCEKTWSLSLSKQYFIYCLRTPHLFSKSSIDAAVRKLDAAVRRSAFSLEWAEGENGLKTVCRYYLRIMLLY